jgi:hypothetical protein
LFVKLFYTACSVFTGLFGPMALILDPDPDNPGTRAAVVLLLGAALVIAPIWWLPQVRRTPFGLPRSWLEVPLLAWAWLAPIAAFLMVLGPLIVLPTELLPDSPWFLLTVPAALLIVLLTWFVPEERKVA